ncbi:hypothetical protein R1sor_007885 [Riccia sorocarpa]|uniref:Uncharacterized protein n=1 Tax=Riccia sorocarpa TaxID=122646 RepID=A0ABD3HY25_9MARC
MRSRTSPSNLCRGSHLGFFTSFVIAVVVVFSFFGFLYKSFSVAVPEEGGGREVDTGRFMKSGVILPGRTDRGNNMASTDQPHNWSELVGMKADEAKKKIQEEHPHLQVVVVSQNAMMTMDYNLRRVRIFKDKNEKVAMVPKLG